MKRTPEFANPTMDDDNTPTTKADLRGELSAVKEDLRGELNIVKDA